MSGGLVLENVEIRIKAKVLACNKVMKGKERRKMRRKMSIINGMKEICMNKKETRARIKKYYSLFFFTFPLKIVKGYHIVKRVLERIREKRVRGEEKERCFK